MYRTIMCALAVLLSMSASGQEVGCDAFEKSAKRLYDRVAGAKNSNMFLNMETGRVAFWEIYELGSKCAGLKRYADAMESSKLGKDDVLQNGALTYKPPSQYPGFIFKPQAGGGGSNSQGYEVPNTWKAEPINIQRFKGGRGMSLGVPPAAP